MFLIFRALRSRNSFEKTQSKIICATFNGNPYTTIISRYSFTTISNESDITTFYNELSSLVRRITKHNVLIIDEGMNAQIGLEENDTFCLHNLPNRNGEYQKDFAFEKSFS